MGTNHLNLSIYYTIVYRCIPCEFSHYFKIITLLLSKKEALCQMLGYSPYESSLAPIIVMVGAILFAQK